jgi:hypothetical protein
MTPRSDTPVRLTGLDRASLTRLASALREGARVALDLNEPAPRGMRLDELAPLFDTARATELADQRALEAFAAPAGDAHAEPAPAVTVVIPTHRRVPLGLAGFLNQDVPVEVLVISNGPEGPVQAPGARLVRERWQGHGATRQAAVRRVRTPFTFFTVDDAIPLGRGFLRVLIEALEDSPFEAMVARQIPWPDADPVTRARLRDWTPPGHKVHTAPQADHVGTLHRTETLRRHPLPDVPIAEDAWWSRDRHVGYAPMAPLLHSHPRAPLALYRRNRDIHAQLVAMGRAPAVSGAAVGAAGALLRPVIEAGPSEAVNLLAELAGQLRGARLGAALREAASIPPTGA